MTAPNIVSRIFKDERHRIFAVAIVASLLWHLLWISTITIVSKQDGARPVKFSKVSFLGPLLGKGAMDLRASPKERSFLEKRYFKATGNLVIRPESGAGSAVDRYETGAGIGRIKDDTMVTFIDDALGGNKLEPSYSEE